MEHPEWLEETHVECVRCLVAILYGHGVPSGRAHDLAEEYVSEAQTRCLAAAAHLESRDHCRQWVVLTATRLARTEYRQERRHQEILHGMYAGAHDDDSDEKRSTLGPVQELVRDALAQMTNEDRRLIVRRFFEEKPLKKIAQEHKCSIATAHRRLEAALQRLKEILIRMPEFAPS